MSILDFVANNSGALLALLTTGAFAGLLAGLLGVGGGIIIVPVLFFLFQSDDVSPASAMVIATATSLATIVPTSISSIRAHHTKGNVDCPLLARWGPFILLGVLLGSWLVTLINGTWVITLFGIIATLSALSGLCRSDSPLFEGLPNRVGQSVMASAVGFFSVLVGIGGGTLSVPLLTAHHYPVHKAVGTAAAIGLIIALPGVLTMLALGGTPVDAPVGNLGLVNLIGFACIVPMTVLCAPFGAVLAGKLAAVKLKKIFDAVLLVTGLRMLAQSFL